jgi:hypothetical protein
MLSSPEQQQQETIEQLKMGHSRNLAQLAASLDPAAVLAGVRAPQVQACLGLAGTATTVDALSGQHMTLGAPHACLCALFGGAPPPPPRARVEVPGVPCGRFGGVC